MCNLISLWLKISIQLFFFPFLFPISVALFVLILSVQLLASVISLTCSFYCNHRIPIWTHVSHYLRCWRARFHRLFLIHSLSWSSVGCKTLFIVINFLVLWFICRSSFLVHLKNGPEYLRRGSAVMLIPLMRFLQQILVPRIFLAFLRYFLLIFFQRCLYDSFRFQYSKVDVIFPFSKLSDTFLMWHLLSFSYFSFSTWHYEHGIFLCKIPFLYSGCIFLLFVSASPVPFHFCKQLAVVRIHLVIKIFLWFCKFVAPCALPKHEIMWHHYYYK